MSDARTVIARAIHGPRDPACVKWEETPQSYRDICFREADRLIREFAAARLAVVPVPEGDVVEAVENVMLRYDADMKLGGNADACRDDLVAPIAAEREACAVYADQWSKPQVAKLAAGEMTAQELRTAQAVAKGIAAGIRARGRP